MRDLVLPAFELDCRDWVVITPADAQLPEEIAGSPLLAVLSTVFLGVNSFTPASGVLTIGLLDDDLPPLRPVGTVAAEMLEDDCAEDSRRYLLPAPDGQLALLAEFTFNEGVEPELVTRIEALMESFRWAA